MTHHTYILAVLIPLLASKLERASKRARRAGFPGLTLTVHPEDETVVEVEVEVGFRKVKREVRKVAITVAGEVGFIDGWEVVGAIDLTTAAPVLVGDVPEAYRTDGASVCDHCNTKRRRNRIVVLKRGEEYLKLGRSCMTSYFPTIDPKTLTEMLAVLNSAGDLLDKQDVSSSGSYPTGTEAVDYLAHVCAAVREQGFRKTESDDSTRGRAHRSQYPSKWDWEEYHRNPTHLSFPTAEDIAEAHKLITWIRNLPESERATGYMANLYAVCLGDLISWRNAGIAASLPQAFARYQERAEERAAKEKIWASEKERREAEMAQHDNTPLGKDGAKIEGTFEVEFTTTLEGNYGYNTLIRLRNERRQRAVWFASGLREVAKGDKVRVRGTVKRTQEYKGRTETVLTRCRMEAA